MKYLKLVISLVIAFSAGLVGSLFTTPNIQSGWYESLNRSALTPPGWVFPVVWNILFLMMGLALWRVWQTKIKNNKKRLACLLFALQLLLNVWWSVLFFGLQQPLWALLEIIPFWLSILATLLAFKKIDPKAGWLLLPYLLWVSFASYLNFVVVVG